MVLRDLYSDITDLDGAFDFELPATGANYQFMVSKDGYVSKDFTAADLAETSDVTISQVGGDALYIRGVVSPSDSEAIVSLYVDGELFGIRTTDEGDFRFDFETDPGDVELLLTASSKTAYGELTVTSIPEDGADIDLTEGADSAIQLTIDDDIENEESDYTYGADLLVEITAKDSTGAPVTEFPNGLVLTLPFNLSQVAPGAFEAEEVIIYHAATRDDLLAGDGDPVPVEDILAVDYIGDGQTGQVTFRVYSLSFFGIGDPVPIVPPDDDDDDDTVTKRSSGGGSSCFISSVDGNSGTGMLATLVVLAGIGLALGRFVRTRCNR